MRKNYDMTIGVNAELVRDLGGGLGAVTAAMLYNMVQYVGASDWGQVTPLDFERRTSFGEKTFRAAQQRLIEAGLIEKRVGYIPGSTAKATFLRLVSEDGQTEESSDTQTVGLGSSKRKALPGSNRGGYNNTYNNHISERKEVPFGGDEATSPTRPASPSSSARLGGGPPDLQAEGEENFSSLSGSERSEPDAVEATTDEPVMATTDPFDEPVPHVVSLKPTSSMSDEDKQAWAVAGEITKYCQSKGLKVVNKNVALKAAIKARLKEGATKEDLMKVAEVYCTTTDEFMGPKKKTLHAVFGVENYEKYLNQGYQAKKKPLSYTF